MNAASMEPIEVRSFASFAAARSLRADVNELNRISSRPDPFSTFEYLESSFRHDEYFPGGRDIQLWFLVAFSAGQLVGYVALKLFAREVMGVRTNVIGFLVNHDNDRPHVVARQEHSDAVSDAIFKHVLGRSREWSLLELQQQTDTFQSHPASRVFGEKNYLIRDWPTLENCTITCCWGGLREYVNALPKKFRININRQMRHLHDAGNLELLSSSDSKVTPLLLDLYLAIERHSWKSQTRATIGRHPERVSYFKDLLAAHQPMRVSIQILLLDGVPIAGLISGAFMRGLYALNIIYDDALHRLAPGSAMLLLGMRQAINGKYEFLNLLSGFGYYKVQWLAEVSETRAVQIYRVGTLVYWQRLLGDLKRRCWPGKLSDSIMRFNPVRRVSHERRNGTAGNADETRQPPINLRAHSARLLAEIRNSDCECLSADQLAVALIHGREKIQVTAAQTV